MTRLDQLNPKELTPETVKAVRDTRIEYARNWKVRRVKKSPTKKSDSKKKLTQKERILAQMKKMGMTDEQIAGVKI